MPFCIINKEIIKQLLLCFCAIYGDMRRNMQKKKKLSFV